MLKNKESNHEQTSNINTDSNNNDKNQISETTLNSNHNQQRPKITIRKPAKYCHYFFF